MTLPVHYSYRIPGVARKPCCNMRNLQRLGDMVSQHTIWLQIGWTSLRSRVLASRPIFSWVFCLRITISVHPSGGSEQSENDDQCIGTFGQSRSPDSGGQGIWLLVDWWMVDISLYILSTRYDTYLRLNGHIFMYARTSRVHQDLADSMVLIFSVDTSNFFLSLVKTAGLSLEPSTVNSTKLGKLLIFPSD